MGGTGTTNSGPMEKFPSHLSSCDAQANIRYAKTRSGRLKGERAKKTGLKNGGMKSEEGPAVMKEEGKKGTVGYSAIANSLKDIS